MKTTNENEKKHQALKSKFHAVLRFLKSTHVSKNGKKTPLNLLPWYLLVGPEQSGKTNLLAQSGINFISHDIPDWWITKDLVLVDTPSVQEQCNDLSKLIQRYRKKATIQGVILTFHFPELMKQQNMQQKKRIIANAKEIITQLREHFGSQLPFYLVITKCDLLPGFSEFFSDCGSDELTQIWGVPLPLLKTQEKLTDVFSHRFNELIKRLNTQLIWKLHQERAPQARPYIKDFPLQLERLKETIHSFLKAINIPDLILSGVYLTSALQTSTDQPTQQALELLRTPNPINRAYFIRQLISQGLHNTIQIITTKNAVIESWLTKAMYTLSFAIIVITALFLGNDFQHGVRQAYSIQHNLAQYQLTLQQPGPNNNRLVKALPLLNALADAKSNATHKWPKLNAFLSFYSNKSQRTAEEVYQQVLQTIVLPEIQKTFENYLQTPDEKNPANTYAVLKAYLLLGDKGHIQADFITKTMTDVVSLELSHQDTEKLMSHVQAAFGNDWQPAELNKQLIAQVRKQLVNLPSIDLGIIILKNMDNNTDNSTIALGFIPKGIIGQIPKMFTAEACQKILTQDINHAAADALQGNIVLGALTIPNSIQIDSLAAQIRERYLANYVDIWESLLDNIQIGSAKNLTQVDTIIVSLLDNHSPLLQLLQTIQKNTAFDLVTHASPKLESLNKLLANSNNTEQNPLFKIFVALRQMHSYLETMLHSANPSQAILSAAQLRMLNNPQDPINLLHSAAEQTGEPMKSWLTKIADQSWQLMLQESAHVISDQWNNQVLPVYKSQIANHYPFTPDSTVETSLQDFISFLGQPGTLNNFYQSYLKAFVNDSGKKWQWKIVNNNKLHFSENILRRLEQAAQIHRAFFQNGGNKLFVQFTLEPLELDKTLKSANININGQQIFYQKSAALSSRLVNWPGENPSHQVSLNLVTPEDQLVNSTYKGIWSWFKLVNKSTEKILSSKKLLLNFTVKGNNLKYTLLTSTKTNPFLLGDLPDFDLEELKIVEQNYD